MVWAVGLTEQPGTELAGTERDPTLKARISGLFPLDAVGRIGPRRVVLGVIFVVVTAVASLARQSGPGALDSIWAEDGLTFYQTTFHTDAFHAVFIPNNGYLQLVPRILIPLIALFPVSWAAALMAAVGALASSACALLVYHASAALVPSRVARLCFVVPTAVVLVGEVEVGNDVVNIQWYLISATFWMMLWNPRTRARRVLAALVLFLAIGSDPLALVFAPLLALRLWSRPLRESAWQLGGTAAGVLLQGGAILSGSLSSRPPVHDYSVPFALRGYWQYVSGRTLASTPELSHVGLSQPIGAQIAGAVAALLVAVAALLLNRSADRLLAAVCAAFSLVFYSFAAMQAGAYADRYAVAPTLLLITALAVLSSANQRDDRQPRPAAGRSRALAYAPLVALCAIVGTNLVANYYGGSLPRANRPSWSSQVAAGRAACRAGGVTSARLETAPNDGWFVTVPCSRLLK
jgi:hypothetical protein